MIAFTPKPLILLDNPCLHSCTMCGWTWHGPARDGIEAAREHRELEHQLVIRRKRRTLGRCCVLLCSQHAVKRVEGRGLCEEHVEVVRLNKVRRGWTAAA